MKIWICVSSPRNGSQNTWTLIKNLNGASRLSKFWNFFGPIQIISCRDLWPWTKRGYITMTRRQSNDQWSGGIAAHSAPQKFRLQKSAGKFLASIFWDQDGILLTIFQGAKRSTRSITNLYWCNQMTFWRKNDTGSSPRGSCSCTTMHRLTGH